MTLKYHFVEFTSIYLLHVKNLNIISLLTVHKYFLVLTCLKQYDYKNQYVCNFFHSKLFLNCKIILFWGKVAERNSDFYLKFQTKTTKTYDAESPKTPDEEAVKFVV